MQVILTIAGFDPSGGAGVLADIKTFAAFGCYGAAAITSITAQNTLGVFAAYHQSPEILQAQLDPILADYEISAVKIGMLPTTEMIEMVAAIIERKQLPNIVLDPVLHSSSGFALIDKSAQETLFTKLMPLVDVVTPNLAEIAALTGTKPTNPDEMKQSAITLKFQLEAGQTPGRQARQAILIKGGHLAGEATDVLFAAGEFLFFSAPKIESRHTHGTGCTLSSAIAASLASGEELSTAVKRAKEYVTAAIINAPQLGKGNGTLNHFVNLSGLSSK